MSMTEGYPDNYIVLCRKFSTGMDLDSDSCMEIFPDGYCTHFGTDLRPRDLNPNTSPLVEMSHYTHQVRDPSVKCTHVPRVIRLFNVPFKGRSVRPSVNSTTRHVTFH